VTQVTCYEVHNWVIVSFFQHVQGLAKSTTERLKETIRHNAHVYFD